MKKKQFQAIAAVLMLGMFATACGSKADTNIGANAVAAEADSTNNEETNETQNNRAVSGEAYTGTTIESSTLFSDRDLSGDYDAAKCDKITLSDEGCTTDSKNVTIAGSTVTITGEGDYILNGALRDGMIIVDVDKSEKVQLVLNGVDILSKTSAAIYVKQADKVFVTLADGTENMLANGGTFEAIDDNNIDAVIFSKDDLTLNGTGALAVDSLAGHGIVSKNELVITNGTYQITAASHGMTGKDNVAIADGSFDIIVGKDAIQSQNEDDDTAGFVYIADGDYQLSVGSDGINALNEIYIAGGRMVIEKSDEGLEARIINITGGEIDIASQDDGLNATDKRAGASANTASGTDVSGKKTDDISDNNADIKRKDFQGDRGGVGVGGRMGDAQSEANINISGGIVRISAEGDGVDSNGYFTMSGGELYVTGPVSGKDAPIDYGIDASIHGGIVVAAGQGNMAQNFGSDSTQGTILVNTQQQNEADSDIVLLDSEENELVAWTMEKSYNSVVISCPEIKNGGSYTVKTGSVSTEVVMDGLVYGESLGFGGGRRDFQKGERPEGTPDHPRTEKGDRPEGTPEPTDSSKKINVDI